MVGWGFFGRASVPLLGATRCFDVRNAYNAWLKITQPSNLRNFMYKQLELYKYLGLNTQATSQNNNKSQNSYKHLQQSPEFIQATL